MFGLSSPPSYFFLSLPLRLLNIECLYVSTYINLYLHDQSTPFLAYQYLTETGSKSESKKKRKKKRKDNNRDGLKIRRRNKEKQK